MKRFLFFSVFSIFCFTISAQTKTWIGPSGGYFSNPDNWSPAGLPSSGNDVIIPTGSNLIIDGADIKSIAIQGDAVATMTNHITISAASSIATNATFVSMAGIFVSSGNLTNNGTINLDNAMQIRGTFTITNNGTINVNDEGLLYWGYGSATLNNTASGIINLYPETGSLYPQSGELTIINSGLIKRSQGTGYYQIEIPLQNNNGTILVESGVLAINNPATILTGGAYNVNNDAVLQWNNSFTCVGTLTGQLDGPIKWNGTLIVAPSTEAILNFGAPDGLRWEGGNFWGDGTLTNTGILNVENGVSIRGTSILKNEGTLNFNSTDNNYLGYGSPTLNNTPSGVINFNAETGMLYGQSGVMTIINKGLIKRAQGLGNFRIEIPLKNNNGTILVETGALTLYDPATVLTDGIYNVETDAVLNLNHTFTLDGTLTGQLDGPINWAGILLVAEDTEAILNFNGPGEFNWISGEFKGEGTLTNQGILNLEGSGSIRGNSILKNEGSININSTGSYYFGYGDPILNNTASGYINILSDGGIFGQNGFVTLNNSGIIKKGPSTGNFFIDAYVNNAAPGKIIAETGLLQFGYGSFEGEGMVTRNGSVGLQNNTVFEGTISPGGFPGTLTYNGKYAASTNAILATEIYGPTAETEYDVLNVQGNASLDGNILVALNYAANLNDEFVILTANSITSCNLPATVTAHYIDKNYTFDVICNPTNVTLKVSDIVLGTEENTLSNIKLFPNPTNGNFTINLGKEYTDVCVAVYNMLGQIISSEKYTSAKTISQEIPGAAGVYFVGISTANEGSNTLRIIKQ